MSTSVRLDMTCMKGDMVKVRVPSLTLLPLHVLPLQEGAVVCDVGISFVADESKSSGYRLVGDVGTLFIG
jgi:5,10-methylene-tetrahydrofolate dehydrogenase/methenyl tetrahydrofolate cyclohydrolase